VLDAFTFIFKETEAGLVQVHAYPFDEHTSTWIVECPEHTWRRLGFDAMDEAESLHACEALFAEELQGHRLMSNRSLWTSFLLVRNESWHRGNVVLLGDAAHTAHFSIGSGTKLAMEDAIALAQAFLRHPRDLERALVDYELERQPVVERFQQAAGRQRRVLLARGAIRAHGPDAVRLQPAHAQRPRHPREPRPARPAVRPRARRVVPRRRPGRGRAAAAVRAVARPAQPRRARRRRAGAMPELARSGAGLVLAGPSPTTLDGRISPDTPTLDDERARGRPVDEVHASGAHAGVLLTHAGRRGSTRPSPRRRPAAARGRLAAVAPSPIPTRRACPRRARWTPTRWAACATRSRAAAAARRRRVRRARARHGPRLPARVVPLARVQPRATTSTAATSPAACASRCRCSTRCARRGRGSLLAVRLNVMDGTRHGLKLPEGIAIARELPSTAAAWSTWWPGRPCPRRRRPTTAAGSSPARRPRSTRRRACRRSSAAT
jgi:anthraniloyl-CoA monooxygenase